MDFATQHAPTKDAIRKQRSGVRCRSARAIAAPSADDDDDVFSTDTLSFEDFTESAADAAAKKLSGFSSSSSSVSSTSRNDVCCFSLMDSLFVVIFFLFQSGVDADDENGFFATLLSFLSAKQGGPIANNFRTTKRERIRVENIS
mmetsp:Transcript_1865/g.2845  ORF Transcript_1865/g.2845 Transcript_1865/m.2845 type:complete len:145 (-) Transcript_1865:44-478(-)